MLKLLAIIIFLSFGSFSQAIQVSDYRPINVFGYDKENNMLVAIRAFKINKNYFYLAVNPNTFTTKIIHAHDLKIISLINRNKWLKTPYIKALERYSLPPYKIVNYGLTKSPHRISGIFLTIDMCPSKKPLEKNFFETLGELSKGQPVPIAISVSGLWMLRHQREFKWLVDKEEQKKLAITWINHSFHHFYRPKTPLRNNFMLNNIKIFKSEVLRTEQLLLEKNQLPSVFFRFPGLVSNKELVLELKELGLIPVGADAWLAKNQPAHDGSVVLVHGNGNEPEGVIKVFPLLKAEYLLPLINICLNGEFLH